MNNRPLLSICIPTYNRCICLDENLKCISDNLTECKDNVEIIISDNCSPDETPKIVEKHKQEGLKCTYIRNVENIGADKNFIQCFKKATGKYVWLLGDDDYLVPGALIHLVDYLSTHECGLFHINNITNYNTFEKKIYTSVGEFFSDIGVLITFMSVNIIRRDVVDCVNYEKYIGSYLLQVAFYCRSAASGYPNVMYSGHVLQVAADGANNGGYNFFEVFANNLLSIYHEPVEKGLIENKEYQIVKKSIFYEFVSEYTIDLLILKKPSKLLKKGAWKILFKNYGTNIYFYTILVNKMYNRFKGRLTK